MGIVGTTGTGLDRAIDLIANDYGLNMGTSGAAIRAGAAAADAMNGLIVQAVKSLGLSIVNDTATTEMEATSKLRAARRAGLSLVMRMVVG